MIGALWLVLPALLFGLVAVLVPLELGRAGWGAAAIAAAFITAAAIETVVAPLLGRFSDRRGRLLPLRFAVTAGAIISLAFAFADRPAAIVVLLVAAAIAFGAFWAPAMALLSDGAERVGLAQAIAFGLMNAAWGAGNCGAPRRSARGRGRRRPSLCPNGARLRGHPPRGAPTGRSLALRWPECQRVLDQRPRIAKIGVGTRHG